MMGPFDIRSTTLRAITSDTSVEKIDSRTCALEKTHTIQRFSMQQISGHIRHAHWLLPLLLCLLILPGCGSEQAAENAPPPSARITNVSVYPLQPDSLVQYSLLPLVAQAWRDVTLSFQEGGAVAEIFRDLDDSVTADQPLARLDGDLLEAALIEAEAGLDFQRYNHERSVQLHADGSIPERELRAAWYELKRAESHLATLRERLANGVLRAPFAGIVASRQIERGQLVQPGVPAFRLVQTERLKLAAWVPENQIVDFAAGSRVEIHFDAYPAQTFPGAVGRIGPVADENRRVFPLEIHFDNVAGQIRPGTIGRARAVRRVHRDVIVVPRASVQERENGPAVFVVEGDQARLREVVVGPSQGDWLIVESGLTAGERVVVKGGRDLIDGDQVRQTEVMAR